MTIIYIVLFFICLAAGAKLYQFKKVAGARCKGIYPPKGNVTQEDIDGLVLAGERVLAITAYRELHGCGLREAKNAIDAVD